MVVAAAVGPRRPGAALVDLEHGMAAREEVGRGDHHVAAASRCPRCRGSAPPAGASRSSSGRCSEADEPVAAAVLERHASAARTAPARQGVVDAQRVIADGLQVAAPPGQARVEVGEFRTRRASRVSSAHPTAPLSSSLSRFRRCIPQFCRKSVVRHKQLQRTAPGYERRPSWSMTSSGSKPNQ